MSKQDQAQQQQEFNLGGEDFPALPGFKKSPPNTTAVSSSTPSTVTMPSVDQQGTSPYLNSLQQQQQQQLSNNGAQQNNAAVNLSQFEQFLPQLRQQPTTPQQKGTTVNNNNNSILY
jgi:hypothetical protein